MMPTANAEGSSSNAIDTDNKKSVARQAPRKLSKLTASYLKSNKESFYGYASKKSPSWLSYLFPFWFPLFKKRYFISCGNFIFRYVDEYGDSPKGIPIPIDASEIIYEQGNNYFEIFNMRKKYFIQFETYEECIGWVNHLRKRKAHVVKENLGHTKVSDGIKHINKLGNKMFQNRLALSMEYQNRQQTALLEASHNPMSLLHIPPPEEFQS